jgi:outer membrane protein OmpA-like peptidoglycan-associated protein
VGVNGAASTAGVNGLPAEEYSMTTSLRRANAVKDALVRAGGRAASVSVIGRGQNQLLIPTGAGVQELQNRRVEILIIN